MIGDGVAVAVSPPGEAVTMYPVIAEPPVFAGAVKETVALPMPATALTLVGAAEGPIGVTEFDAVDAIDVPIKFVATTVNV